MDSKDFESQTRDQLEQVLNQLQAANLLIAQLETQIANAGQTVRELSQLIETFNNQQGEP